MTGIVTRLKRTENPRARSALLRTRGLVHYAARGHVVRRLAVRRYLAASDAPRLQIGAGSSKLPGWLDSDLIAGRVYVDLTRRLPLSDASFAYVFGEHVVEHLTERQGLELFAELHRILLPGGVLRLTTPDLRKIIAIYEDRNEVVSREAYARFLDDMTGKRHERACQIINDYLRLWGHQYVYDEEDLKAKLLAVGFASVARCEPGESSHETLRGIERHGGQEWINRAEAMCLEATRATRPV